MSELCEVALVGKIRRSPDSSVHAWLAARVGIQVAAHHQLGAVAADAGDLGRQRHRRHEDVGRHARPHGGIRHGGTVITARGRHYAGRGDRPRQEVGEGAPGLERAGVLYRRDEKRIAAMKRAFRSAW